MPSRPSIWRHSQTVHQRMLEEADDVEGLGKVWRGFTTHLIINELGLSTPYYSYVTQALQQTDAVRQLKRGSGTTPSEWLILEFPDRETFDWKLDRDRIVSKGTRTATKEEIFKQALDGVSETVRELVRRVDALERRNNG